MNEVLVTGANSFIGKSLIEKLKKESSISNIYALYHKNMPDYPDGVQPLVGDISNPQCVKDLFGFTYIDTVFHLAARPTINSPSNEIYQTNVMGTANLTEYCEIGTKFIFMSSSTVYGDWSGINKAPCHESVETIPTSIYGASKLCGETMVATQGKLGKIEPIMVRSCAVVGAGASHGLLPDLIRKIRSKDKVIKLLGNDPGSLKPYIHVDSLTDVLIKLGKCDDPAFFGPINVSASSIMNVLNVAKLVMEELKIEKDIEWTGQNFVGDNPYVWLSNLKMRYFMNDGNIIKSEDEIRKAVRDILTNEQLDNN